MFIKWTPIIVLAKSTLKIFNTQNQNFKLDFIIRIITDKKLHFYHKMQSFEFILQVYKHLTWNKTYIHRSHISSNKSI